jgi:hypothetical protein
MSPKTISHKAASAVGCSRYNRRGGKHMPGGDRRVYKLTDLLTTDELNRTMILFIECKRTNEDFKQRCSEEVVEPIISRINEYAGYNTTSEALVYRLEMYVRTVRGEAWAIH